MSSGDSINAVADVLIDNGTFTLSAGDDAIHSDASLTINNGSFTVTKSVEGIESNIMTCNDGVFSIVSTGDAIHADTSILIGNGTYTLSSGDDAIHADTSLTINNAAINILKCVEGIESKTITFKGGNIHVASSDDSVNSTSGAGGEGNDGSCAYINGGTIVLNTTRGDGLDSNGSLVMTNGTVIIHGPSSAPEVAIDYNGTFNISGGVFIGSGSSSNMTQAPSSTSSQNSLKVMFKSSLAASTIFRLQTNTGTDVMTFRPVHQYQSIIFSSSTLQKGASYSIYTGGTYTGGSNSDGVCTGGTYSGGTLYKTFTISQTITQF